MSATSGPDAPNFLIGLNPQGGWTSAKGWCSFVRFYTRALSDKEIYQNFNSLKRKFNL